MQAALDLSFYVLGGAFVLGLLMVLLLLRDVFFHGRFNTVLPAVKRVPTTALDAARQTLEELKAALQTAQGERRDTIGYELRHLEHRISALEDKTYTDQSDYYDAAKARERAWREWRAAHEEARQGGFAKRREMRNRVDELRQTYRELDREVADEFQRAVARDTLTLEELHAQGVLRPEVLYPPEPAADAPQGGAPTGAASPAPEQAEPAPADATQAGPSDQPRPPRGGKWITPLPPYPPASGGLLAQADMARPDVQKSERTYVDTAFSMAGLPGGMLSGADLSRSSFAEVEFVGTHRYVNCVFAATDLRRIELRRAEQAHIFQDCDLHGASLQQAQLAGVVFRRCNLTGTHWRSARLDRVRFESCQLGNVHWEGVDLSRTVMSEDMLADADFEFASKPPLNLRPAMDSPEVLPSAPAPVGGEPAPPAADAPTLSGPDSASPATGAPAAPSPPQPAQPDDAAQPAEQPAADPAPRPTPPRPAPPTDET